MFPMYVVGWVVTNTFIVLSLGSVVMGGPFSSLFLVSRFEDFLQEIF